MGLDGMSFRWASDDNDDNDGMTLIYYKDIIQFYVLITIKLK